MSGFIIGQQVSISPDIISLSGPLSIVDRNDEWIKLQSTDGVRLYLPHQYEDHIIPVTRSESDSL